MQSWSWPDGPQCIAEVFLAQGWAKNIDRIDLNDLSTALSLWNNCTIFDIQPNTLKKLREVRNSFFAHNSKLEVSDDKLKTIFMVLGVLFRDGDLTEFVDEDHCLQELDKIKQKNGWGFGDVLGKLDIQSDKLDDVIVYIRNQAQKENVSFLNRYNGTKRLLLVLCMIISLITLYVFRHQAQHRTDQWTKPTQRKFIFLSRFIPLLLIGYIHIEKS